MSLKAGFATSIAFSISQTALIANTSVEIVSPVDGYIDELSVIVQAAVTTGGSLTVLTGDTGAVTVAALAVTVAGGATKGTRPARGKSTEGSATRAIKKGDRIQIKPTGFATAGAVDGFLVISSADTSRALA